MSDDERQRRRREMAENERVNFEKEMQGAKDFGWSDFSPEDRTEMEEVRKLRAKAEYITASKFSVHVQDEHGKPIDVTDRVGYRDQLFSSMIMAYYMSRAGQGRQGGDALR